MQKMHRGPLSEFGIASLSLGILSFVQLAGFEKAIAAIVFGILGLRRIAAPQSEVRGEGLAAAGIVLGVIYSIIAAIFLYTLFNNPELLEEILQRQLPRRVG